MPRRQLVVSLPLAVLVAVLAHGLCFGVQHLPGAAHAAPLLSTLAAGVTLVALAALFAAAFGFATIVGSNQAAPTLSPPLLAAGGFCAFGVIELAEGHAPFATGWPVVAAVVVATAAVWFAARLAARVLMATGRALASFAQADRVCAAMPSVTRCLGAIVPAQPLSWPSARGRAPPPLAGTTP